MNPDHQPSPSRMPSIHSSNIVIHISVNTTSRKAFCSVQKSSQTNATNQTWLPSKKQYPEDIPQTKYNKADSNKYGGTIIGQHKAASIIYSINLCSIKMNVIV